MAREIFPDSPTIGISPRISFSHDNSLSDGIPVEQYIRSTSPSSIDFDFCVFRESLDHESSSADELFFDGKILPLEIKRKLPPRMKIEDPHASTLPPQPPPSKKLGQLNETKNTQAESEEKQRSFWRFKRSSSLNCGGGYGTLCPLPILSRSNSTGSSGSGKRSSVSNNQKQRHNTSNTWLAQKQQSQSGYSSKPPLKKNNNFSYSNGIKFNPVLNVPPANLFGLASIFSGAKDRCKKKH